jgi:hypothetical protein
MFRLREGGVACQRVTRPAVFELWGACAHACEGIRAILGTDTWDTDCEGDRPDWVVRQRVPAFEEFA